PASVNPYSANVRYEDGSATLIVGNDLPTSDGLQYDVTSVIPNFQQAALESAGGFVPDDVAKHDTELPSSRPQRVRALAATVTADQSTTYAKALRLQDWFRENFKYNLQVRPGQSVSAIEDFLFNTREGYCEQFAGTYAAMARAIGMPTRVAVGFTPGE